MTILNGQPIGDPAPRPQVMATPVEPADRTPDPTNFVLSVMALIFAFAFPLAGAIMGGIAMGQSRRAGHTNAIAKVAFVTGLALSILVVVATVALVVFGIGIFGELFRVCGDLGEGTHDYNGVTYTCG